MNRFHLLSLEDEETSSLVAPEAAATPRPSKSTEASMVKDVRKEIGRNDRKSRNGPRKGEGEKHQNVGKGSWGRPTDAVEDVNAHAEDHVVEEGASVAEQQQTVEPPKPAYKTVSQYLAEQEEQQRRLATRSSLNVRRAHEGAEIDSDYEVVRKEEPVLRVGGNAHGKKIASSNCKDSSSNKRLTLQELDKILPLAERRSPTTNNTRTPSNNNQRNEGNNRSNNGERRPRSPRSNEAERRDGDRPRGPRSQTDRPAARTERRDGDRPQRSERREGEHPRGSRNTEGGERRFAGTNNNSNNNANSYNRSGSKLDLNDASAFPALA